MNSAQPGANSQEEINAAQQQKGRSTAPDVFDLGQSVALANTAVFAPYKVEHFAEISDAFKDPNGLWVNDYGGYMSIGFDSTRVGIIAGVDDLLKPELKAARPTGLYPRARGCSGRRVQAPGPRTTSPPASSSSASSRRPVISCRWTRPRPRSPPGRRRW